MSLLHFLLSTFFVSVSAILPFYTLAYMHLMVLARRYRNNSCPEMGVLPYVTVQLPIYNERYVVGRLISSVCSLDYPREKLQIIVADDSNDDTSEICTQWVEQYARAGFNIIHVRRRDRRDFKAGALQNALTYSTGEFIAIFDADYVPPKDFLKRVLPYFSDSRVGLVQARWGHLNRDYSPLTAAQALALDLHFTVEQRGRDSGGLFLNFNGTAGVWRRSCIEDAGGWLPSLAEDLDLSYRAQLRGWRLVYLDSPEAPAEIPVQINAVRKQQYRWAFGAAQTTSRYLTNTIQARISPTAKIHAFIHLTRHIPQLLLTVQVMLVPLVIRDGSLQQNYAVLGFMALYPVTVILSMLLLTSGLLGKRHSSILGLLRDVFLLIILGTGTSVNNSIAVIHAFLGGNMAFDRTPKFGIVGRAGDWGRSRYILPFQWLALADILIGLYSLYASLYTYYTRTYYFLPLTVIFSASLLCIGFATIAHSRPIKKRSTPIHNYTPSRKLLLIFLAILSVITAVASYARSGYTIELAATHLDSATSSDMEDLISHVEIAIQMIPSEGNPVWILPTPLTELSFIRNDLEHIKNRLVLAIRLEDDTELYHATYEDVRQALQNMAGQLKVSMPYVWLGPEELSAMLVTLTLAIIVLVRR
ncbi:MAG: glycosyltransferase [Nitrososphaerota archaeon]